MESQPQKIVVLILLLLVSSCATSMPGRTEPSYIVIRNETGQNLFSVVIREDPDATDQPGRLGSVSPLLAGNSFSIRRGANPEPLNDDAIVTWEQPEGNSQSWRVSIRTAIDASTGAPDEALVFRILPGGRPVVALEQIHSLSE